MWEKCRWRVSKLFLFGVFLALPADPSDYRQALIKAVEAGEIAAKADAAIRVVAAEN